MTRLPVLAQLLTGLALTVAFAAPAAAQSSTVDRVDRVPGASVPGPGRNEAVRLVKPGALLFASFDRNFDGVITPEEIDVGAAGAFAAADKNKDGVISGFEQSDWATLIGAGNDVFSNPMAFDLDLDRAVTPAEFAVGIKRFADTLANPTTGNIAFVDLIKAMKPQGGEQAERGSPAAPLEPEPVTR
jgi:hypothetical protein